MSVPLAWTIVFMFAPYAIMFTYSFYTKKFPMFVPDFQFGNYLMLFQDIQYRQVFIRTFKIASIVSLVALLLAYPVAYCLVFKVHSRKIRMAIYMAIIVPLWASYLLRAYTWKTILGSQGVLNSFLVWSGILAEPTPLFLYNQLSMVITLVHIFVPFMFMPIFTALEKIPQKPDGGLEGFGRRQARHLPESDAAALGSRHCRRHHLDLLPFLRRFHRALPGRRARRLHDCQYRSVAIRHGAQLATRFGHFDGHSCHRAARHHLERPDRTSRPPRSRMKP